MIYFTADLHFGHENAIKYCNRPFKNTNKMDSILIKNYNSVVSKEDMVYFLGDLSLRGSLYKDYLEHIVKKMNGHKHLILGNHDRLYPIDYLNIGFESVHTSFELYLPEIGRCVLNHDPAAYCAINDWILLCGHVHTLFRSYKKVINVGIDVWNYFPVSLDQIQEELENNRKGIIK